MNRKRNVNINVERFNEALLKSGYTKAQLVKELDCITYRGFVHAVNEAKSVDPNLLKMICDILNVNPDYLTGDSDEMSAEHKVTAIYCNECVYWDSFISSAYEKCSHKCRYLNIVVPPNHYCSYAKKRSNCE